MWFKSIMRSFLAVALLLAPAAGLAGCGSDDPADKISDAVEDAGDAANDAAKEAGDAVKDATE